MDGPGEIPGNLEFKVSEMLNKLNLKESPSSVPEKGTNLPKRMEAQGEQVQHAQTAGMSSDSKAQPTFIPETSPFRNQMPNPTSAWTPGPGPQRNQVRLWQNYRMQILSFARENLGPKGYTVARPQDREPESTVLFTGG